MFSRSRIPSPGASPCARIIILFALAILAPAAPSFATGAAVNHVNTTTSGTVKHNRIQKKEIEAIKKLIDQHEADYYISVICDKKTSDTLIKKYVEKEAARDQQEMKQLKAWLKSWYKISYTPPVQGDASARDENELAKTKGSTFDDTALQKLHDVLKRGELYDSQAANPGFHPELRNYAKSLTRNDQQDMKEVDDITKQEDANDNHDVGKQPHDNNEDTSHTSGHNSAQNGTNHH